MGDMSEMRGLIVGLVFLGVIFGMLAYMPQQYLQGYSTTANQDPALQNLLAYNETYLYNFTGATMHRSSNIAVGGWNIAVTESHPYFQNGTEDLRNESRVIQLEITDKWWITDYFFNREDFRWLNNQSTTIDTYENIEVPQQNSGWTTTEIHRVIPMNILEQYYLNPLFRVRSSRASFDVAFYYDTSIYTSPLDAYNHTHLAIQISIDFNERNTQSSSWDFIFSIIFWRDVPFLDPITLLIIRLPIMICFGYLLFIFVLRVIGAVFGGGGA